jgi:hypothetical protein
MLTGDRMMINYKGESVSQALILGLRYENVCYCVILDRFNEVRILVRKFFACHSRLKIHLLIYLFGNRFNLLFVTLQAGL